jgi:hypothetical protein
MFAKTEIQALAFCKSAMIIFLRLMTAGRTIPDRHALSTVCPLIADFGPPPSRLP